MLWYEEVPRGGGCRDVQTRAGVNRQLGRPWYEADLFADRSGRSTSGVTKWSRSGRPGGKSFSLSQTLPTRFEVSQQNMDKGKFSEIYVNFYVSLYTKYWTYVFVNHTSYQITLQITSDHPHALAPTPGGIDPF